MEMVEGGGVEIRLMDGLSLALAKGGTNPLAAPSILWLSLIIILFHYLTRYPLRKIAFFPHF